MNDRREARQPAATADARKQAIREAIAKLPLIADAPVEYAVSVVNAMLPEVGIRREWSASFPADTGRHASGELRDLALSVREFRAAVARLGTTAIEALNKAKAARGLRWPPAEFEWSFARPTYIDEIWPELASTIDEAADAMADMPAQPGRPIRGSVLELIRLLATMYEMLTGKRPSMSNQQAPFTSFVLAIFEAVGIEGGEAYRYSSWAAAKF